MAVSPDGARVYVTNQISNNVAVISAASGSLIAAIPVGAAPSGIAITSDGTRVYVANFTSGSVSVIDTTTNTVVSTVSVGSGPFSFGKFITPDAAPSTPPAVVVPTTSGWALLTLTCILGILSVMRLRRPHAAT